MLFAKYGLDKWTVSRPKVVIRTKLPGKNSAAEWLSRIRADGKLVVGPFSTIRWPTNGKKKFGGGNRYRDKLINFFLSLRIDESPNDFAVGCLGSHGWTVGEGNTRFFIVAKHIPIGIYTAMSSRDFYLLAAEAILVEAGVQHVVYLDRAIRAYTGRELRGEKRRYIVTSRPTTVNRLLAIAHEAAHVYFRHGKSVPSHRTEYEAENYSYSTLERYGIEYDREKHIAAGQAYIASKIRMGRGTLKQICCESYFWSQKYLRKWSQGKEVIDRVKAKEIKLVNLKRPDPTQPPKPRTRSLEITFYEPENWHSKKSTLIGLKGYTKRYKPSWTPDLAGIANPLEANAKSAELDLEGSFADIIRARIDQLGLSDNKIAEDTGIAQPVITRLHNGTRENLRLDIAERMMRYLGIRLHIPS